MSLKIYFAFSYLGFHELVSRIIVTLYGDETIHLMAAVCLVTHFFFSVADAKSIFFFSNWLCNDPFFFLVNSFYGYLFWFSG